MTAIEAPPTRFTRHRWHKLRRHVYVCRRCGTGQVNSCADGKWTQTYHRPDRSTVHGGPTPACVTGPLTAVALAKHSVERDYGPRRGPSRTGPAGDVALTLKRPWTYAVLHLGKRTENRTWPPPPWLVGRRFYLHEGLTFDDEGAAWIESTFGLILPASIQHASGGVLAASAVLRGADRDDVTPWDAPGQWHWRLDDVAAVGPRAPCRGARNVWTIPADAAALLGVAP